MKPSFTPNISMASPTVNIGQSSSSNVGEDLAKAIQLPTKAAGIVTMGIMGKVLQHPGLPPKVINHLKSVRFINSSFFIFLPLTKILHPNFFKKIIKLITLPIVCLCIKSFMKRKCLVQKVK